MIPEFPTTRSETFLAAILGESVELPVPQSREDLFLAKIAGMDVALPAPQSRTEIYLAAILGADVALPVPVSRVDLYLAKVAGMAVEIPEPLTRIDEYLAEWAENGSGWSWETVTGVSPLALTNALAKKIKRLIQYGKCTQSATPTPSAPVDIVCNNGVLRYGAVGKNLCNTATDVNGYAIDANGNETVASTACYSALIPVTAGEYAYSGICSTQGGSNNKRVHGYTNGVWVQQIAMYVVPAGAAFSYVFSVPSGIDAVRISHWSNDAQTQVERGSTATAYEPFVGGIVADGTDEVLTVSATGAETQTASVANLLSVGDYADEQDIISGGVTHKVGIKVFDGTEDWTTDTYGGSRRMVSRDIYNASGSTLAVVCSHYIFRSAGEREQPNSIFIAGSGKMVVYVDSTQSISTVDDWKAFLAEQYAAGTPVIVIYPLATETTEHTTPQPLSTVEGDNTVSWTAEVSGTVKEVEYAYEAPSFEWKTASGAVVSVSDALAGEVGALTVSINPVQTGSGDPSPANVRPIFGWASADVCVTGVNIWNPETSEPGYLSGTGTKSAQSERNEWLSDYIPVPSGATKLTLCANGMTASEQAWFGVGYYNADKTWIKRWASTSTSNTVTVTLESNAAYIRVMARAYSYGKEALFAAWGDGVSYEQYVGAPATAVSFGGTYYGGTLDVLTGVLTVTKAYIDSYAGEAINEPWISSMDKYVSGTTPTTGAQVVYTLATPQTVQLTPAQVSTLLGTNVIWASGNGEVSVTYRAEASE